MAEDLHLGRNRFGGHIAVGGRNAGEVGPRDASCLKDIASGPYGLGFPMSDPDGDLPCGLGQTAGSVQVAMNADVGPQVPARREAKTNGRNPPQARNLSSTGTLSAVASALVWLAMAITASNSPYIAGVIPLARAAAVWEWMQYPQPFATETAM